MIIGQSLTAPILTGGMKSRIVVTCTGATSLTLTTPSSIVIPGVAVGNVYTFDNLSLTGTYVVTASNGSQTKTQNVLVDVVGIYNVTVAFRLYLYENGNECTSVTGGWYQTTEADSEYGFSTNTTVAYYTTYNINVSGYSKAVVKFRWNWGGSNTVMSWKVIQGPAFNMSTGGETTYKNVIQTVEKAITESTVTPSNAKFILCHNSYGTITKTWHKYSDRLYLYKAQLSETYWATLELFEWYYD